MRAAFIALTAAIGLVSGGASPARAQEEAATLAVPTLSLTFSALYIAEDAGFWGKLGLKVKSVSIAGVGAFNSVISGSSDFAIATGGSLTRAAARGQRMLAIANTVERPMMEIVVRKDALASFDAAAPMDKRAASLKGLTIAVDAVNSITHGYLKIVAKKAGLDPERDITVTPLQPPSMVAALRAKSVAGFAFSPPWSRSAVADGSAVVLISSPQGDMPELVPFAYNLVLTRPDVCSTRRSVCEKMGRGIAMATAFIRQKPDEAMALLVKRFPQMEPKQLKESFKLFVAATPKLPVVTIEMLKSAELYNVEAGLLKKEDAITDFSGLHTDEYVR